MLICKPKSSQNSRMIILGKNMEKAYSSRNQFQALKHYKIKGVFFGKIIIFCKVIKSNAEEFCGMIRGVSVYRNIQR